jgi:hypothetical protein
MDQLQTRLDALEQQMHTVTRRLRWWRGLAAGLLVLAVLTWALPSGMAKEDPPGGGEQGLAQRVAALEDLLKHFSREKNEIFITGANLHIVNGLGSTGCFDEEVKPIPDCPNGLGNLIVGYNESRVGSAFCLDNPNDPLCRDIRTGSHNVVVGQQLNFSRFGGLVVGLSNTISGDFAAVSGGFFNTASGGERNTASGSTDAVSGGFFNTASGEASSVSGGEGNAAIGFRAAVSGGTGNTASGDRSSVSEGSNNTASSSAASVSGGGEITQDTVSGWSAGSGADKVVVGNFRSP